MAKKPRQRAAGGPPRKASAGCGGDGRRGGGVGRRGGAGHGRIEALLPVDERGQMVLPKNLRERLGIEAGDKMVAVAWKRGSGAAGLSLVKADSLKGLVAWVAGPVAPDRRKSGRRKDRDRRN